MSTMASIREYSSAAFVGRRKLTDTVTYEWHLRELHAVEDECSRKVGELEALKRELSLNKATIIRLAREREEYRRESQDLRGRLNRAPAAEPAIPKPLWRKLASLCHPDKHDGSQVSHEVMSWLNSVRK